MPDFYWEDVTAGTYWWCCIWHRKTSWGRAGTPSGQRCSWASMCQCHRWRFHSRFLNLNDEGGKKRPQQLCIHFQLQIDITKLWQCSSSVGYSAVELNILLVCAQVLMITPVLCFAELRTSSPVPDLFPAQLPSLMLVLIILVCV